MFDSIERIAKLVQNVVIIVGILGGGISLLHSQYDRRVERTVAFSKDFNSSVRKSYLSLLTAWDSYAGQQNFYDKDENGKKEIIENFFKADEKRQPSLDDALDFYDTLYICVYRRSCDRNSALDFFGPSVTNLFQIFAFHIFDTRDADKDPSVGKGLELLYHMKRDSWWWDMYL
jgi:hypothetical protein